MSQRVEIIYEALVRGQERVADLAAKTKDLESANAAVAEKVKVADEAFKRQEGSMLRARHAILAVRKELFAIGFAIGLVAAGIKVLSLNSDALTERLEFMGNAITKFLQPAGNFIASIFGNKGDKMSLGKRMDLLSLESDVARLRGNNAESVRKKLEAEEIKLNDSIKTLNKDKQNQFKSLFEERKKLIIEETRLAELGLKRQIEIWKDFQRDVVGALQGGASDTIFKFLQGEKQSGADVFRTFQTGINRAISDAISNALMTSLASGNIGGFFTSIKDFLTGRSPIVKAQEDTTKRIEDTNRMLERVANCVCQTASNTGALLATATSRSPGGHYEGTITPPDKTGLQKTSAILGLASAIVGGAKGMGGGGGELPPGANITMGSGAFPAGHTGGFVRSYQVGGEVPILAQPGEFVVRKSVAQRNREMLKELNMGGNMRPSQGSGMTVFIKANDASSFDSQLATSSARSRMEMQLIRAISTNGTIRRVIQDFAK